MKPPKGAPRTVVVKLDQDEARSLEFALDELVKDVRRRHPIGQSMAADQLIERYQAVSKKVRIARNPDSYRRQLADGDHVVLDGHSKGVAV